MACGWLAPPVLPALWFDSGLLEELPTQLGAVVLTYVSLEAFFSSLVPLIFTAFPGKLSVFAWPAF